MAARPVLVHGHICRTLSVNGLTHINCIDLCLHARTLSPSSLVFRSILLLSSSFMPSSCSYLENTRRTIPACQSLSIDLVQSDQFPQVCSKTMQHILRTKQPKPHSPYAKLYKPCLFRARLPVSQCPPVKPDAHWQV